MAKKNDSTNSTVGAMMAARGAGSSGGVPSALILAIIFIALIIAGGMFLWFDIVGARTAAISFLQQIEPESQAQESWLDGQTAQLAQRETALDGREKEVSRREKELDAYQLELEAREAAFMAEQQDEVDSPVYRNAVYLGEVFSGMEPATAAVQIQTMEDQEQIKRILRTMPIEDVIAILELMPQDFAAELGLSILGPSSY